MLYKGLVEFLLLYSIHWKTVLKGCGAKKTFAKIIILQRATYPLLHRIKGLIILPEQQTSEKYHYHSYYCPKNPDNVYIFGFQSSWPTNYDRKCSVTVWCSQVFFFKNAQEHWKIKAIFLLFTTTFFEPQAKVLKNFIEKSWSY